MALFFSFFLKRKGENKKSFMKERKPNGQFQKGNDIGAETRFKPGNSYVIKSKYKDEYCDAMLSYFMNEEIVFPTFEDFASSIGVLAETLKNWAKKHARFGDTHARCTEIQKHRLLVGGLTERFNPQIVKFLAINNHGMKEKIEQDFKGDVEFKVNISFFEDEEG